MDHNVTRGEMKNLVTDKPSPITVALGQKSDKDGLFTLMDHNVTRGEMKNLVTDKPSPITTALGQKAGGIFKLDDKNVTKSQMKNLVTDKPSPIVTKLAQKSDKDGLFTLMDHNVTRGEMKNLVTDKPSPITVALGQKSDKDGLFTLMDHNVTRGEMKNLVTDKPSPITVALAQLRDDKKNATALAAPVQNKTSMAQAEPTITGMDGDEQIYGPARVGGNDVKFAKGKPAASNATSMAQRITGTQDEDTPFVADITIDGEHIHFAQKEKSAAAAAKQKQWFEKKDDDEGTDDEEVRKLRRDMKNGILSYTDYMKLKGNLLQQKSSQKGQIVIQK